MESGTNGLGQMDDKLFVLDCFALKQWAFANDSRRQSEPTANGEIHNLIGRIFDFPEICQRTHVQRNDTYGRLVPIGVLEAEMMPPPRLFRPRQALLDIEMDAA